MQLNLLTLFIPTFFFVSLTPGMCMTLALTLGMSVGFKRSLHMMWGELLGVGLVAVLAAVGVATLMLEWPLVFTLFKVLGGLYLAWLGFEMWRSRGRLALPEQYENQTPASAFDLASRGFITAIANPKGWAFFIALLPPFLVPQQALAPQLAILISIILLLELICLLLYASGGQALRHLLLNRGNVRLLNRIAGTLMVGVGLWLMLS